MAYINTNDKSTRLVVGLPIGDAKSLETRGVPINDKSDTPKVASGSVVYVDTDGKLVPFTDPKKDFTAELKPIPYGVVWWVDEATDDHDLTPHKNEAIVVVDGVIPIKKHQDQLSPVIGEMVNPYGGAMRIGGSDELTALGICDAVQNEGTDTIVAVRIAPAVPTSSTNSFEYTQECVTENGTIGKYTWVYLDTTNTPKATDTDRRPKVKSIDDGGSCQHVYGLCITEPVSDQQSGKYKITVRFYGVEYVPYIYKDNPSLAALKSANGGVLPPTFTSTITHPDGRVGSILMIISSVVGIIGAAVGIGEKIYGMVKGRSTPAKCIDDVSAKTPKFYALLEAEGGKLDVEPDGYLGLYVNTSIVSPAILSEAVPILDATEMDANGNALVREGIIYAGADDGVRHITPELENASSFYGVSAAYDPDDPEAGGHTSNGAPVGRLIRDGHANVLANSNWKRGAYIDHLGREIPADDEEYVPRIGRALRATSKGMLGSVDIKPFNPNKYIIINYCNNNVKDIPLKTMVRVIDHSIASGTITRFQTDVVDANPIGKEAHPGPLKGVAGVLTRFDANVFEAGDYSGRAIIQVGGYLKCKYDANFSVSTGYGIAPGGWVCYLRDGLFKNVGIDISDKQYMDIIGRMVTSSLEQRTEEATPEVWLEIQPRTVRMVN